MSRDQQSVASAATDDRREQVGWYFYDWAASAFSTTVVTALLAQYLPDIAQAAADANGYVYPLGIPIAADAYYPFITSLSVVLQVFFLPIMGAIADYSHRKKQLLAVFAYIGAFATMGLYFLEGTNYQLGGALFVIANLAFGASIVFYNAFLPEIASPDRRDAVSSQGWALGYLGGGLLLAANLGLVLNASALGLTGDQAVRISLASAGVWWAIFTLIPLRTLRRRDPIKRLAPGQHVVTVGFTQLARTLAGARRYPQTLLFLVAYLFYNDGIQTVIGLAGAFASQELQLSVAVTTGAILMVQFVAFLGALAFGYLARLLGSRRTILLTLLIWTGAVVFGYFLAAGSALQFYILSAVIALVLGGSQALSRSVFSLMIPRGQEAEYFSLYEVSERGTSWLGPFFFGLAIQFTGSYRVGILSLVGFFIVGIVLLLFVDIRRAAAEAGNEAPSHA